MRSPPHPAAIADIIITKCYNSGNYPQVFLIYAVINKVRCFNKGVNI